MTHKNTEKETQKQQFVNLKNNSIGEALYVRADQLAVIGKTYNTSGSGTRFNFFVTIENTVERIPITEQKYNEIKQVLNIKC